jgi:hypothetical protein
MIDVTAIVRIMVVGINRRNDRSDCDIQYPYLSDRQSSDFTEYLFNCLSEQSERFLWQAERSTLFINAERYPYVTADKVRERASAERTEFLQDELLMENCRNTLECLCYGLLLSSNSPK